MTPRISEAPLNDQLWGLTVPHDKEHEIFHQFDASNFNFNDDKLEKNHPSRGGGVNFSITNSLDVLRERMLGAIRRNHRKTEVVGKAHIDIKVNTIFLEENALHSRRIST